MIIFVIWIVCVIATASIAGNKGRSVGGWLLLGILLGPIALLFAAVASNKNLERQLAEMAASRTDEAANLRRCPFCAERIQREAVVCRFCGKDVHAEPALNRDELPRGSATRGYGYMALAALLGAALIYGAIKSGSSPSTETATAKSTVAASPGETIFPTPQQQAYLATCNRFAWHGDTVQCEVAPDRTLRIYQRASARRGDSEADTVKYLINHPERLRAIKRAGFDKLNSIVLGGNGPGRNSNVTMSIGDDGKFNVLKMCYDGTDNQRHCDPAN